MSRSLTAAALAGLALAAPVAAPTAAARAEDGFLGTWQPYSAVGFWFGALTVAPDRLSYETGATAGLARVRPGGAVFRTIAPHGDPFLDCGNAPPNYIGFRLMSDGKLAVLHYLTNGPPPEPAGDTPLDVIGNPACSVGFFTR